MQPSNFDSAPAAPTPTVPGIAHAPVTPALRRAGLNPFVHFGRGVKNLLRANLGALLVAAVLSVITTVIITLVLFATVMNSVLSLVGNPGSVGSELPHMLGELLLFAIATLVINAIIGQAMLRLILTGNRGQKVTLGAAFGMSLRRFGITVLAYIVLALVFIAVVVILAVLSSLSPVLSVIGIIASVVLLIMAILELIYLGCVLIDDQKPTGPIAAIKASMATWRKSRGATVLYMLMLIGAWFVLVILFSMLSGGQHPSTASDSTASLSEASSLISPTTLVAFGIVLSIETFIGIIIDMAIEAGLADIYNDVHGATKGAAQMATPVVSGASIVPQQ